MSSLNSSQISLLNLTLLLSILLSQTLLTKAKSYSGISGIKEQKYQTNNQQEQLHFLQHNNRLHQQQQRHHASASVSYDIPTAHDIDETKVMLMHQQRHHYPQHQQQQQQLHKQHNIAQNHHNQAQAEYQYRHQQHKHQPQQHHSHQHYNNHHQHHHHQEHDHDVHAPIQHPYSQTSNPIVAHNKMQIKNQQQHQQHHQQHLQQQQYQQHQQYQNQQQYKHQHLEEHPKHHSAQFNINDDDHDYNKFSSQHLEDFVMDPDDTTYDDYSFEDNNNFSDDNVNDERRAYERNSNHIEQNRENTRITRQSHPVYNDSDDDYSNDDPAVSSAIGSLTKQKFEEVGTPENVQKTFNQHQLISESEEKNKKAADHLKLMQANYTCKIPMLMVVYISDEASKKYNPSCTVLHRCSDSTGCCFGDGKVCRPEKIEMVDVFVFEKIGTAPFLPISKKLENHTSCHCVPINEVNGDKRNKRSYFPWRQQSMQSVQIQYGSNLSLPNRTVEANGKDINAAETANSRCHCPSHFNITESPTSKCNCDCLIAGGASSPCHRLKNGEEGFAVVDRKCISDRSCRAPTCTYGDYNLEYGRCPHPRTNYGHSSSQIIGFG